jgi:hypothetical protein
MVWRRTPAQDAAVVVRGRENSSRMKVNAFWESTPWRVRKSILSVEKARFILEACCCG